MGYDAYSYSVFGIRMKHKEIRKVVRERACDHDIPDNAKFCPTCGQPAYTTINESIIDSFENDGLTYFYSNYDDTFQDDILVGFSLGETSYNSQCEYIECQSPTQSMIDQIVEFCREHDLEYTAEDCKTYVFTHHSY